jgi:hypothetical protein
MTVQATRLQARGITDWASFHTVFADTMGFPGFYGRNQDAWIDCMSYLDDPEAGMTRQSVAPGELFHLEVADAKDFQQRLPEIFRAFIECAAIVNRRRTDRGEPPILSLILM